MSHRIRVGVIRGGPSNEYEVSLDSGAAVLSALRDRLEDRYDPVDVFIDRNGAWHILGREIAPENSRQHFDIAWNALHGAYGEDGKIQSFLEAHGIPFTGSGSLSSAVGMNKALTKKILKDQGIKSPYWKEARREDIEMDIDAAVEDLFTTFLLPAIIKPAQSGSSIGVSMVRNKRDIGPALEEAMRHGDHILVEEYIPGREATCGVIDGFRGQELYTLPVTEIRSKNPIFDYKAKYAGESEEIVPGRFSRETKAAIEDLARSVHRLLRLKHYSRTDFIIHPRRGIYVLETNTLPGLTEESLVPKALRSIGSDLDELVDHVIKTELGI